MSLDDLDDDVLDAYSALGESVDLDLDRETRNELAMLVAVFDTDDPSELLRRGVHLLFRQTVDRGDLDFQLRRGYDVTYDEYLAGMTYEEMTGEDRYPNPDDERRYQM